MKSKRSKMTDIPLKVKKEVWQRDKQRCVFCGNPQAMPNAHVIPRSKGGLGVARNVITLCMGCHIKMDNSVARRSLIDKANRYLDSIYGKRDLEDLIYDRHKSYR